MFSILPPPKEGFFAAFLTCPKVKNIHLSKPKFDRILCNEVIVVIAVFLAYNICRFHFLTSGSSQEGKMTLRFTKGSIKELSFSHIG